MPSSLLTKEWGFFVCTFYIFFSLAIVFNPSKVCRYWFWSGPQMCVSSKVLICGQYLNVEVSVSFLVQYSSGYSKARSTWIVLRAKSIVCIMCNILHPFVKVILCCFISLKVQRFGLGPYLLRLFSPSSKSSGMAPSNPTKGIKPAISHHPENPKSYSLLMFTANWGRKTISA